MLDAPMVRGETVLHPPEDGLGPAADADLAVDGPDVRLDGIRAQVGQRGHLGVALALGDQRQDLRLAIGQTFAAAGPVEPAALGARRGGSLTTSSPACTASSAATSSRAGSAFER